MRADSAKRIAGQRIEHLFSFCKTLFSDEQFKALSDEQKQAYADRYVQLACSLATRHNVTIPSGLKRQFCRHCKSYFREGINVRTRLHDGRLVRYCMNCRKYSRYPYENEQS
ncbi:MAG: ribonuclease P protein component 4 [Nanoarchaeota archaeon]